MEDIHEIKGLIKILPFWQNYSLIFLIAGVILCLGSIVFIYCIRKKFYQGAVKGNELKLTPYDKALTELIKAQALMQPGMDKILSTKISEIIREYLENGFMLPVCEKTTEEFLHDIQQERTFQGKVLETLAIFLEMCDLAKFAKIEFRADEQKTLYRKANTFLELAHQEEIKALAMVNKEREKC